MLLNVFCRRSPSPTQGVQRWRVSPDCHVIQSVGLYILAFKWVGAQETQAASNWAPQRIPKILSPDSR
ncbi:unnamed protein product [Timema podura]|uniref:Uncharacterized protein n=1 Tax=Timema podura TaxID=61482 RepID=A0ABN7P250_TIMPD|nr:unnamed protein product [Timema podura]